MHSNDSNWHSFVQSPQTLADYERIHWDDTADLVVVGFGGAGATAAVEARQQGLSVNILDRFEGGGATVLSGGVIYAGGGTRQQREAGVEDSTDAMFNYLKIETQGCVSDELLREFCETSAENMDWLESIGLEFPSNRAPAKTSYPMNPYYLYFSGNEGNPANKAIAKPAERGHRHNSKGQAGYELFNQLKKAALSAGATLTSHTQVQRLLVNKAGKVIGVEARRMKPGSMGARIHGLIMRKLNKHNAMGIGVMHSLQGFLEKLERNNGYTYRVKAEQGVILATGGYINNPGMTQYYIPKYEGASRLGAIGCDGSGIRLGQSVGGDTGYMEHASAWRFINPPNSLARGIIVNARGERYCNEGSYGAQVGYHMCEENDGAGWVILDARLYKSALKQVRLGKVWGFQTLIYGMTLLGDTPKGESLAALAQKVGFDTDTLTAQVEQYNRITRREIPDPMQKHEDFFSEIKEGPFYAVNIGKHSKTLPLPVVTFGGLTVEEQSRQVAREDGSLVDGLYAVGRCAVGLPANQYMSGFSIADCVFTGRKASRAIAAQASSS